MSKLGRSAAGIVFRTALIIITVVTAFTFAGSLARASVIQSPLQNEIHAGSYVNTSFNQSVKIILSGSIVQNFSDSGFYNDTIVYLNVTSYTLECLTETYGSSHIFVFNSTVSFASATSIINENFLGSFPYANSSYLNVSIGQLSTSYGTYRFDGKSIPMDSIVIKDIHIPGQSSPTIYLPFLTTEIDSQNGVILNTSSESIQQFSNGAIEYFNSSTSLAATNMVMIPNGSSTFSLTPLQVVGMISAIVLAVVLGSIVIRRRRKF